MCASVALILNLFVSHDWCFSALAASLLAVTTAMVAFYLLNKWRSSGRLRKQFLWVLVAVIGFCCGFAFRMSEARALELVFNAARPPGISNVVVNRSYSGGPGDYVLFLRFNASQNAFRELLSQRSFVFDHDVSWAWSEATPELPRDFWEMVFGGLLPANHPWRRSPPPDKFEVYRGGDGITPRITLLWDMGSQVAYVLYSVG